MGLQQHILTSLYMFHHTVLSSLGLHAEIVSIYLLFIPILLSHLLQTVFSVRSLRRKTLHSHRLVQHLHCYIPNQNLYRHIKRRRERKRKFIKPSQLYHLTARGRSDLWFQWQKQTILKAIRNTRISDGNFWDKISSASNNALLLKFLYVVRMVLYATVSKKITSSESPNDWRSTTSTIFLGGIVLCSMVAILESKPVGAVKMSPQLKAYRKNAQRRQKRTMESAEETVKRRSSQRERAQDNKETNNRKRKTTQAESTLNQNEKRRTSNRIWMQQQRDKARRRKNFSDRVKRLMYHAARAIQVTNTDVTGKTNREHQSHVCIVCDCFLMGSYPDGVPSLSVEEIRQHRDRLSIHSYETFYNITLKDSLVREYTVPGLEGMMLSTRSRKVARGRYATCKECKRSMKKEHTNKKTPPKFSVANGNAIGTFPTCIPCCSPGKVGEHRTINEDDLNPVLKAFMSPVRPFGYVFQHHGGKQKCISGHYQFFETDQNCVTGALNYVDKNIANNVFVMICGATTPRQNESIKAKTSVDIDLYKDIRTWFVKNSSCRAFRDEPLPNNTEELKPTIIRDSTSSGLEEEVDPNLENTFGGVTYAFSSAQNPL